MLLMDVGKFSNVYILWFFYRCNGKFILNIVNKMILRSMLLNFFIFIGDVICIFGKWYSFFGFINMDLLYDILLVVLF